MKLLKSEAAVACLSEPMHVESKTIVSLFGEYWKYGNSHRQGKNNKGKTKI